MELGDLLYSQGFGTRRVCAGLIAQGRVSIGGQVQRDLRSRIDVSDPAFEFRVDGQCWPYRERAYLMLHKPAGYECSHRPGAWPSVYSLLPSPLRWRPGTGRSLGVQAVGRLDQDTTGLLLFSDDGVFVHRLNSPRRQVPKIYEVLAKHVVDDQQVRQLTEGVRLRDDPHPVRAVHCEVQDGYRLRLTLTEGKYHQVKRMVSAVGNRVEALHRPCVGALELPPELEPGQWRWLDAGDVARLQGKP